MWRLSNGLQQSASAVRHRSSEAHNAEADLPELIKEYVMETTRIRRSRNERMIAGVAGGLATYFNIDPLLVRLGFALLAFFNGFGILLYLILWLLLPNEDSAAIDSRAQVRESVDEMRTAAESAAQRVRDMFNKS